MTSLPQKLANPNTEAARAAFLAATHRSVSNGERCAMAPFTLIELSSRVPIRIQKTWAMGGNTIAPVPMPAITRTDRASVRAVASRRLR